MLRCAKLASAIGQQVWTPRVSIDPFVSSAELHMEFKAFRARCMAARRIWNLYTALYECEPHVALLQRTADAFFSDVQEVVVRHLILEVCVLTDPAASGKDRDNLTVERIEKRLKEKALHSEEIGNLRSRLVSHGNKIRPARHKVIAHADLPTSLIGDQFGQASDGEWQQWWNDLQAFCDETGRAIGAGPLDF